MIKLKNFCKYFGLILFWFLGVLLHSWSALALYYRSFPSQEQLRLPIAIVYIITVIFIVVLRKSRTKLFLLSLVGFLVVAMWFSTITPKADASYPQDVTMPYAEFQGDIITVHNVRNSDYRTRDDADVHYEIRVYNISDLKTVDLFMNYWGDDRIAHTILSFGFANGEHIAVSVETRREIGEVYSEWAGLFKQYELIYIWADERDVIRLRTNYRKERVYLYRTTLSAAKGQDLFIDMMIRTSELYKKPEFYDTIKQNCTNTLVHHIIASKAYKIPFWKRRIATGAADRRAYNERFLDTSRPFEELRKEAFINDRAIAADKDLLFSEKIRTHL